MRRKVITVISLVFLISLLAFLNIKLTGTQKVVQEEEPTSLIESTNSKSTYDDDLLIISYNNYIRHKLNETTTQTVIIVEITNSHTSYAVAAPEDRTTYEVTTEETATGYISLEDASEIVMEEQTNRDGYEESGLENVEEAEETEAEEDDEVYEYIYSNTYFKKAGVINWGGWTWTWYSERVLPGGRLRIPGRHTDELGYVRDENGYLCLASSVLSEGTVVDTPFGSCGKVYDSGCESYILDVYVNW